MFGLGGSELAVIAVIVLLIFGAKRLPEIGKGLGGAIREFKSIKKEISEEGTEKPKEAEKEGNRVPPSLEAKVKGKVLEQVPGVKRVMDVKHKAEKMKELLK